LCVLDDDLVHFNLTKNKEYKFEFGNIHFCIIYSFYFWMNFISSLYIKMNLAWSISFFSITYNYYARIILYKTKMNFRIMWLRIILYNVYTCVDKRKKWKFFWSQATCYSHLITLDLYKTIWLKVFTFGDRWTWNLHTFCSKLYYIVRVYVDLFD
jgi:hypothetical protein